MALWSVCGRSVRWHLRRRMWGDAGVMWLSSLGGFFHQHGIHSSRRSLGGVLSPSSLVMSSVAMAVSSEWGEFCRMFLMFLIHFLAPPL